MAKPRPQPVPEPEPIAAPVVPTPEPTPTGYMLGLVDGRVELVPIYPTSKPRGDASNG